MIEEKLLVIDPHVDLPIIGRSKYGWQDHLVADVARFYAEEYQQPFLVAVGRFEDYDCISLDGKISVECKTETTTSRSGNVAIEYFNSHLKKASGIFSTKANLWLHIVLEAGKFIGYEWKVDNLRRLAMEEGVLKPGGTNALLKIIPLSLIKAGAIRQLEVKGICFDSLFNRKAEK